MLVGAVQSQSGMPRAPRPRTSTEHLTGHEPTSTGQRWAGHVDASQTDAPYPAHWEAEVVLHDGDTVHVRPIRPEDGTRLENFYQGVSPRAKHLRFLSSMPSLSEDYITRLTHIDYHDRVVLVVTLSEEIIAIGQYGLTKPGVADTAVLVQDQYEGHGIGQLLMAGLVQIAQECGVHHFTAEVLVQNHRMIQIMRNQYEQVDQSGDAEGELHRGIVYLEFDINDLPTTYESGRPSPSALARRA